MGDLKKGENSSQHVLALDLQSRAETMGHGNRAKTRRRVAVHADV